MRVYIACGLTHVPCKVFDVYTERIHFIAEILDKRFNIKPKYALINSDPQLAEELAEEKGKLCYEWDRKMVEESELVIAEASFPSTGLGMEVEIANQKGIPVLLIYTDYKINVMGAKKYSNPDNKQHDLQIGNGIISLMLKGNPTIQAEYMYSNKVDLKEFIINQVSKFLD